MRRWFLPLPIMLLLVLVFPREVPAPLIYTPGEGWKYERVGEDSGSWVRDRAQDQLQVARQAFEDKKYRLATKAAKRTVRRWPFSDYAPEAQYWLGRSYEERDMDEKAFDAYQTLLEKYPKTEHFQEVLQRQYEIANRYLQGQWFKLWGYIPVYPSMNKTVELYENLIKNAPYSTVAPKAQMDIGQAREKQDDYPLAVKAYEKAADRYHDRKAVAADAVFKAGQAYLKQAKRAEYDQHAAVQAINTFTDFMALYPNDERVEEARKTIEELRTEQARGSFQIARFYEKKEEWEGALIYYNEVVELLKDPNAEYAQRARERIENLLQKRSQEQDRETAQR